MTEELRANLRQHTLVESVQHDAVFCLNHTQYVCLQQAYYTSRILGSGLFDRLRHQFKPADPVASPCSNDLGRFVFFAEEQREYREADILLSYL
jgi:hypothetical protein